MILHYCIYPIPGGYASPLISRPKGESPSGYSHQEKWPNLLESLRKFICYHLQMCLQQRLANSWQEDQLFHALLGLFCKSFIRLCKHQFHNIASFTLEPHNHGSHPSPVPHGPRQLVTHFSSLWIHLLGIFYIVCDLLWLTSFIQHVFSVHPCCRESTFHSFLYAKYRSII